MVATGAYCWSVTSLARHARGTVLVVDDEPTIRDVVSRYLVRAGYDTIVAATGRDALRQAGEGRPDVVVLDLMLPDVDGLEVMRRLRQLDRSRTAIVLLTARGEESDRVIGLRLGADDYVVKPFSPAELVARVDAMLRRLDPVPDHEPPLLFDGLEIDPSGRRVLLDAEPIDAHAARVRAAAVPRAPPGSGIHPRAADGVRLAVHLLHRHLDGHGAHPAAADKARARPRSPPFHPDDLGGRVQVLAMRRRAARITAAVALAAGLSALAGAVYGASAFTGTFEILGPLGAATVLFADLIAARRSWIRGVRSQLAALAVLIAAQIALAVALFASLMFVSNHDAFFMALAAAYAGADRPQRGAPGRQPGPLRPRRRPPGGGRSG